MSKLFSIYYKTFLRNEIIENEFSETVDLSPADCEHMVRNTMQQFRYDMQWYNKL